MGNNTQPSCGLLLVAIVQCALLVTLFSVSSNSISDTYFMAKTDMTTKLLLELRNITNQTHSVSWIGAILPSYTTFTVLPVTTAIGIVLMLGLFIQSWTYRMSTNADMTMEMYTPEVLSEHAQWDAMFIGYIIIEHALIITMLCNPLTFSFLILHTVLITLCIVERCAPRGDQHGRNDTSQSLSTISLAAGAFVFLQVLFEIKRHLHTSKFFFIVHILLDCSLVLGHAWDARNHQFATAMNCRAFFVISSSCLLLAMFLAHSSYIAGHDTVGGMVSGIYDTGYT
jgi:hypothetical protein